MDWNVLLNSMVTGLFVGIGSTVGTWLVTRTLLKNIEKLEEKLRNTNGNGKAKPEN
jgi:hypothetical protein